MDPSSSQPAMPSFEDMLNIVMVTRKPAVSPPVSTTAAASAFASVIPAAGDALPAKKKARESKRAAVRKVKKVKEVVKKKKFDQQEATSSSLPLLSLGSVGAVAKCFGREEISDDRSLARTEVGESAPVTAIPQEVVRVSSGEDESADVLPLTMSLRRPLSEGLSTIGEERSELRSSGEPMGTTSVPEMEQPRTEEEVVVTTDVTTVMETEGDMEIMADVNDALVMLAATVVPSPTTVVPDNAPIVVVSPTMAPAVDEAQPSVPSVQTIVGGEMSEAAETADPNADIRESSPPRTIPAEREASAGPSIGVQRDAGNVIPPSLEMPSLEIHATVEELRSRVRQLEQALANMTISHNAYLVASQNTLSGSPTDIVNFRMGARYAYDLMVRRGVVTPEMMAADVLTNGLLWWFYA